MSSDVVRRHTGASEDAFLPLAYLRKSAALPASSEVLSRLFERIGQTRTVRPDDRPGISSHLLSDDGIAATEHADGLVSIAAQLFEVRSSLKILTATVAMHLSEAWRKSLFRQMDDILDQDAWDSGLDALPTADGFRTLLRLIIYLKIERRPGLGIANNGDSVATWDRGTNRLTIQCSPLDRITYIASVENAPNTPRDLVAGKTSIELLRKRLDPFDPGQWFYEKSQS